MRCVPFQRGSFIAALALLRRRCSRFSINNNTTTTTTTATITQYPNNKGVVVVEAKAKGGSVTAVKLPNLVGEGFITDDNNNGELHCREYPVIGW
jgi:hypothetical protein